MKKIRKGKEKKVEIGKKNNPDRRKQYKEKNKERIKKQGKEYRNRPEVKKRKKERSKAWYAANPDYNNYYYNTNKDTILPKQRAYHQEHKEERNKKQREYNKKNWDSTGREKDRIRKKKKYDEDAQYRLKSQLRHRLWMALKAQNASKNKKTMEYLGCSVEHYYKHMESQFRDGMNWENMGTKPDGTPGWQRDERKPCAEFDFTNEEEIHMCFHYTNLQPLWKEENQDKGDKFDEETFKYKWTGREPGWILKVEIK